MSEAERFAPIDRVISDLEPSSDPVVATDIGGEVNGNPFDRDLWLVYHGDDIEVFQADAEFVVEVGGARLPGVYATCDEAVRAARRSRAGAD